MQKTTPGQKVFHMISSAQNLKHKIQKLNILGQKQIFQLVPVVLDCLGHFVPIYSLVSQLVSESKTSPSVRSTLLALSMFPHRTTKFEIFICVTFCLVTKLCALE